MSDRDELVLKLRQDIRDMFQLEAQRNDLNYALSGVERGEMTLQDYEDDLSLAIANYFVKDILPAYIDQVATRRAAEAHMQGWHEGRAAANNPELKYSYTTGLQPTKGSKDE